MAVGITNVATAANQYVTNTDSSGEGSLPYAVEHVGEDQDVIFTNDVQQIRLNVPLSIERSMNFVNQDGYEVQTQFYSGSMTVAEGSTLSMESKLIFEVPQGSSPYLLYGESGLSLGDIAASLSVNATNAYVIYSNSGDITINTFTGGAHATTGQSANCIYSSANLYVMGTFNASDIFADANMGNAYGIYANNDIEFFSGLSGKVVAKSANAHATAIRSRNGNLTIKGTFDAKVSAFASNASALSAVGIDVNGGNVIIEDGISGTIHAVNYSTTYGSYGIECSGSVNGGDADTPLVINSGGTVQAESTYSATGISCSGINLKVEKGASLIALNTASGEGVADVAIKSTGDNNDKVELVAGSTVVGSISTGEGNDTLTLSGLASDSTTIDGSEIASVENISVTGGKWTFNGDITGDTDINITGGSFDYGGTASAGILTIGENSVLRGNGTFASLNNSGTISPGNSIGTITVNGNFTSTAGSQMLIEINGNGQSDQIVVGGTATLNGTVVSVVAANGSYNDGDTYTFLTAGGGVSATSVTIVNNMNVFDTSLVYHDGYVEMLLTSAYDSEAETPDQLAVALYLDNHSAGASGDFQTVLDQFNMLSVSGAQAAFDSLSGEMYGSLSTVGIENTDRFLRTLAARLRSRSMYNSLNFSPNQYASSGRQTSWDDSDRIVRGQCPQGYFGWLSSGWNSWAEGYGVGANIAGNGNASGLGYSTGGLAFGIERCLDCSTLFGVVGGYSNTGVTLDQRGDHSTIDSGQVGLYLHRDIHEGYATGIVAYGHNNYDTRRHVAFGTIDRLAEAGYGGNEFSFYAETGWNYHCRKVHLQPFAALQYIQLHQDGFDETGANSVDLSVGGINADSFRGLLGTRLVAYFQTDAGRLLSLEGRALWRHEFLDEARVLDATFAGQPGGAFVVNGVNVDRDAAILGGGLSCYLADNVRVFVDYDVLVSENYTAHAGTGGLALLW